MWVFLINNLEDITITFSAEGAKMLELELKIKEQKKLIEMQKGVIQDHRETIEKIGNKN